MPPVIEFNEKAKPQLAKAFGGSLELDHYYLLKTGSTIKMIKPEEGECPPTWMKGQFTTGPDAGCVGWWYKDGLYQGKEYTGSLLHVLSEVDKPPEEAPPATMVLKIGSVYKTKSGYITQPMILHQTFDGQINGPVFKTRLVAPEDKLPTTGIIYYNQKGGYLGHYSDSLKVIAHSARALVSEVIETPKTTFSPKMLSKMEAKQLWLNDVKLLYKEKVSPTGQYLPFPKQAAGLYTEHWFDLLHPLDFKVEA